jgi:PKD repeat protein
MLKNCFKFNVILSCFVGEIDEHTKLTNMLKFAHRHVLLIAVLCISFALHSNAQTLSNLSRKTAFSEQIVGKIEKFETTTIDVASIIEDLQGEGEASLEVTYLGETYTMDVYPNTHLKFGKTYQQKLEREGRTIIPSVGETSKGQMVSITFANDFIYGTVKIRPERSLIIQPLQFFVKEAEKNEFILFYSDDVLDTKDGICGTTHKHDMRHQIEGHQESMQQTGQCLDVEIAIASDFSMFQKYGSVTAVEDRNVGVMNDVQTNYDDEFGDELNYVIVDQFVSDCSTCDPWTSSTAAGDLLDDFTSWGPSGFAAVHDVGALWTDRDFNGGTIGLAWVGTVCFNFRYHVLQDFSSNAEFLRVLKAHELGHNFDAVHDASGSPFIMAPSVSQSTTWSSLSIGDVDAHVASVNCLSTCAPDIGADFQFSNDNICQENEVHFYDGSSGDIIAWDWDFPGGSPSSSTDENPVVTYNNPGVYDVTLEVENSAGQFDIITIPGAITVSSNGEGIQIYQDFENGLGDWTTQNNGLGWQIVSTLGNSMGGQAISVNNTSNPPNTVETLVSPGFSLLGYQTATLHLDHAYARRNGQSDSLAIDISIDGGQTFQNVASFFETGSGTFSTAPNQSGFFEPATADDWCDGAFASCIAIPLDQYVGNHEVQIRLRNRTLGGNALYLNRVWVSTDCYDLFPPIADFSADVTIDCASFSVNFEDLSILDPIEWFWEFEGGTPQTSTEQNPTVLYTTEGVYEVSLTVSNPEGSDTETKSAFIVVTDVPEAGFSFSANETVVNFTNESLNGDTYAWDFGDGNTSTEESPEYDYLFNGTYVVELVASNNCGSSTISETITIEAAPTGIINANVTAGCTPLNVTYDGTSSFNADSFFWTFEGGTPASSTMAEPQVQYDSAGTFDVILVTTNAFGADTVFLNNYVSVSSSPEADFSYVDNELEVTFSSMATGFDSLSWDFGDGNMSSETNPIHTYANEGTYEVVLVAMSQSCGNDTSIQMIDVDESITASYVPSTTEGCATLEVQFTLGSNGATSVNWVFEGGTPASSSDFNPVVSYNNPGVYDVELIVSDGVTSDTLVNPDQIIVNGPPSPAFTSNINLSTVQFTNSSANADAYVWDFGDGATSTETDPEHIYQADGSYVVGLSAINECDTITTQEVIEIATPPSADFSISQSAGCIPLVVNFTNESSDNSNSFTWIFEGGSPAGSNIENPEVFYSVAGVYDVTLIVASNGGMDTLVMSDAIEVFPDPVADFSFIVDSLTVSFTNISEDATSYHWDFGDGNTSNEENPTHVYAQGGSYDVVLTAINDCDSVAYSRQIGTGGLPQAAISIIGMTEGCTPFEVLFEDGSQGNISSWEWTFEGGTPSTSTEQNPTVIYNEPGTYDVSLKVTNAVGDNEITRQNVITVHEAADGDFTFVIDNTFEVDFDGQLLTDTTADVTWLFGDGASSNIEDVRHVYAEEGTYEVHFIVSNFCNADTTSKDVVIMMSSADVEATQSMVVYPNPTQDYFQIKGFSGQAEVIIVDLNGKIFFQRPNVRAQERILTNDWPAGVYTVNVRIGQQLGQFKLIVQQ